MALAMDMSNVTFIHKPIKTRLCPITNITHRACATSWFPCAPLANHPLQWRESFLYAQVQAVPVTLGLNKFIIPRRSRDRDDVPRRINGNKEIFLEPNFVPYLEN